MNNGLIVLTTDGWQCSIKSWSDLSNLKYETREYRRAKQDRWVAPEHMKLGKYITRSKDEKRELQIGEAACVRCQKMADRKFVLDKFDKSLRIPNEAAGRMGTTQRS